MQEKNIKYLLCPSLKNKRRCGGDFSIIVSKSYKNEVLYGILVCTRCKARYPILLGIPVLLDNLHSYFKEYYFTIKSLIRGIDGSRKNINLFN